MVNVVDDAVSINILPIYHFGNTDDHPLAQTVENYIIGMKAQMKPTNGIADSINVRLGRNETYPTKCALYKVSDNSLVGETEEKILTAGQSWEQYVFNEPKPQLIANEMYYICVWAQQHPEEGRYCSISYDENIYDQGLWFRPEPYGLWPNLITLNEWGVRRVMSIYCIYDVV